MQPAIRVENLSKVYRLNLANGRGGMPDFRETLVNLVKAPLHRLRHTAAYSLHTEEFWALREVSFEVQPGEVLGIIGRNGAGKSTLLKILSRVTEPTSGRAEVRGRVGSLLEVGTGFHPELSGRENVFLNGAILGMARREIQAKFDEIVEFSGVERFLDTPVKRYSSGMRVRLAFAVAAHLDPEMLLIDEVLSVGDAEFQKKCLGKMDSVAAQGRTVLFVSHNMGAVKALCSGCILLRDGCVEAAGDTESIVSEYLEAGAPSDGVPLSERTDRQGNGRVRFVDCRLLREPDGMPVTELFHNEPCYLVMTLESETATRVWVGASITDPLGSRIMAFSNRTRGFRPLVVEGRTTAVIHIPHLPLLEGGYGVEAAVVDAKSLDRCDVVANAVRFCVMPTDLYGSGIRLARQQGVCHVQHRWLDSEYEPLFSNGPSRDAS